MKKFFLSLILLCICLLNVRADEGMWLLNLIAQNNIEEMQKLGLKLSAEDIYSVNKSSLKDAIVHFGRGCTGEIISDQGLLLTNHHCGYGSIQAKSSVEHDYLTDGFWARSYEEELPIEGLSVRFLIEIRDVSAEVLKDLGNLSSENERNKKIKEITQRIEKEAEKGNHYLASVYSFYEGNEFYLFIYEVYNDVRLVGAPPGSIGRFGADTDNWMWPRHKGDFSLFRVYCSPDGQAAAYSKNNVPLKPKHYLPINIGGYKKGDFSMIIGYPGSTERYLTSYGISQYLTQSYPSRIRIREAKLAIMLEDMQTDPVIRIKYASKHAGISNYWKYFIGATKALNRQHIMDKKKTIEDGFRDWYSGDEVLSERYGAVLTSIEKAYQNMATYNLARICFYEAIMGCEAMVFSRNFKDLDASLSAGKVSSQENINAECEALSIKAAAFFKNYNQPTDLRIMKAMMALYYEIAPREFQPDFLIKMGDKSKGDFSVFTETAFKNSIFVDEAKLQAFLKEPSYKVLQKDPLFLYMKAFTEIYLKCTEKYNQYAEELNQGERLFIEGLRAMQPERNFYPDANSSMRLTYGRILDYDPANAVHYDYFTSLDGVMAKEDPNNWEFVVPPRLKELWQNKDYGPYGENGSLHTCFISDNDITGGNSGSPVLNAKGELIGLAFDGNWEGMSSDILFDPEVQRTISVDIRYVLFLIDKYAQADNIMAELKIVQ